jgi:hypothetical protein
MRFLPIAVPCVAASIFAASLAVAADSATMLQIDADHSIPLQQWIDSGGRCGTAEPAEGTVPFMSGKQPGASLDAIVEVPVAFHVIYKETYKDGKKVYIGNVPDSQLDAQIRVLNAAYASAGFVFTKRSVDRRSNSTWFKMSMGSTDEATAKRTLAIDPTHVLNIYTASPGNNILGWAYFPWAYPETNTLHGVVLLYSTLPGGSAAPYNLGHTATHEIGHYLGLFHTFQNACRYPGDSVSDTPDEATPAYGCPTGRNTCVSTGYDPINNYMDYTDDACMTNFTAGQAARMRWAVQNYRRGLPTTSIVRSSTRTAPAPLSWVSANPNPFNPTTRLEYQLDVDAHVTLDIYDVAGRHMARVFEGNLPAGRHESLFEASRLSSGVYMAVLRSGNESSSQRLVLTK